MTFAGPLQGTITPTRYNHYVTSNTSSKQTDRQTDTLTNKQTPFLPLQLFHRFGNQSLMLTVRAARTPPTIRLSEGQANFSLKVAIDVYVMCNQTTPGGVDFACDGTMPLAMTIEMVRDVGSVCVVHGRARGSLAEL